MSNSNLLRHFVHAAYALIIGLCISNSVVAMSGDYDTVFNDSDSGGYVSTRSDHSITYKQGSWKMPSQGQVIRAVIKIGTVIAVVYICAQMIMITMVNGENSTGAYHSRQQYEAVEVCPGGNRSLGIVDGEFIREVIDYISCRQIGLPSEARRFAGALTPEQTGRFMELLDLKKITLPESAVNNPFVQYYLKNGFDFFGSDSVAQGSTEAPFYLLQTVGIDPNGEETQAALAYCKELLAKFI